MEFDVPGVGHCRKLLKQRSLDLRERRQTKAMEEKGVEAHLDETYGRPEREFGEWMRELVLRQQMLRADSYISPEVVSQVGSFAPATSSHNVATLRAAHRDNPMHMYSHICKNLNMNVYVHICRQIYGYVNLCKMRSKISK